MPGKLFLRLNAKRSPKKGELTNVEQFWKRHLEHLVSLGEVQKFGVQDHKLRLADLTYYTPDFSVLLADGQLEFHETKGSWKAPHQDDSRVKIKVAAETFPQYKFVAYEIQGGKNSLKVTKREVFGIWKDNED